MAVSPDGLMLIAGDDRGILYQWDLGRAAGPRLIGRIVANGSGAGDVIEKAGDDVRAVTAMRFLIGGRSLVVGDAGGGVATWFAVPVEGRGRLHAAIHRHRSTDAPIATSRPRSETAPLPRRARAAKMHHYTSAADVF